MHPTPSYSPVEGKVSKGTLSGSGPKLFGGVVHFGFRISWGTCRFRIRVGIGGTVRVHLHKLYI